MSTSATAQPRTLAEQLRGWSDEELVALLTARPDLALPAPQDTSQLASRAATRASVLRAVGQLTLLDLTVLEAVLALGGAVSGPSLRRAVCASDESGDEAVSRLRSLALLWGSD